MDEDDGLKAAVFGIRNMSFGDSIESELVHRTCTGGIFSFRTSGCDSDVMTICIFSLVKLLNKVQACLQRMCISHVWPAIFHHCLHYDFRKRGHSACDTACIVKGVVTQGATPCSFAKLDYDRIDMD